MHHAAADRHLHDPGDQLRRHDRGRADRASAIPFEVGISRYRELARGQIIGDSYGMLKLLVSPEDRSLLGVHVFGTGATEIVHIGQAVMGCGGTVDYLVDAVFNYPTLVRGLQGRRARRHEQDAPDRSSQRLDPQSVVPTARPIRPARFRVASTSSGGPSTVYSTPTVASRPASPSRPRP